MNALPAKARTRLAALLGMLGSDHDGEVTNAARAARRLIQHHGLTWLHADDSPRFFHSISSVNTERFPTAC
jgi:hypothetical protein